MTVHGDGTLIACRTCSKGTRARYRFVDTEAHHGDWSDASVEAFLLKRLMTALQLHMFVSLDCTPADHVQGRMSFLLMSQLLFWHEDPGTPKHQGEVNRLSSPDLWRCPTLMMFAFHCKGQQKKSCQCPKLCPVFIFFIKIKACILHASNAPWVVGASAARGLQCV